VVTHDLPAVERHAGRVAILSQGRLVALGDPREIGGADLAAAYRRLTGAEPESPKPRRGGR
jgi:ABC-type sulfate/molybdate transport systems ATPase subunit